MRKIIFLKLLSSFGLAVVFFLTFYSSVSAALEYREVYTSTGGSKRVIIFIDSNIQSLLFNTREFQEWKGDLEQEDYMLKTTEIISGSPSDLRDYIKGYYHSGGLEGVIMIGDLPYAIHEGIYWGVYEEFPIDLFFTDMNGSWQDTDSNGRYDAFSGEVKAEIWLGRIKTSNLNGDNSRDSLGKIRYYLNKVHYYKHGLLSLNRRALFYNDDDWADRTNDAEYLRSIYSDVAVVVEPTTTSASDYKRRLRENYEWIHVSAHSSPMAHGFLSNGVWGDVNNYDLIPADPLTSFYNLFACSSVRYTYPEYMGGYYIFNRTHGLTAVGSTKVGSMLYFENFYPFLGSGHRKSIGEAFKIWFSSSAIDFYGNPEHVGWFFGMTVIGDPTLTLFPSLLPFPTPTVEPTVTPIQTIINKVMIQPPEIMVRLGNPPVGLSALAYDTQNRPIWTGVSYEWGISSQEGIGNVHPTSGNITNFTPLRYGGGQIYVIARYGGQEATKTIPVHVTGEIPILFKGWNKVSWLGFFELLLPKNCFIYSSKSGGFWSGNIVNYAFPQLRSVDVNRIFVECR